MLCSDGQYSALEIFTTSCFESQVNGPFVYMGIFARSVRFDLPGNRKMQFRRRGVKPRDVSLEHRKSPDERPDLIG